MRSYLYTGVGTNGWHIAGTISKSWNELAFMIHVSLKFVPKDAADNNSLFQVVACRRTCDKPLSAGMVSQSTVAYIRHRNSMS